MLAEHFSSMNDSPQRRASQHELLSGQRASVMDQTPAAILHEHPPVTSASNRPRLLGWSANIQCIVEQAGCVDQSPKGTGFSGKATMLVCWTSANDQFKYDCQHDTKKMAVSYLDVVQESALRYVLLARPQS